MAAKDLETIVALCKRRGFLFPGSEIYGGFGGTWDYGPLGVELKRNIKEAWWNDMVHRRDDVVGLDAAIMMNPKVWEASGHVESFADPLVECKTCHERIRADQEDVIKLHEEGHRTNKEEVSWTAPRNFNLLVKAFVGVVEEAERPIYLRGEITQGVYVNFRNVVDSVHPKIPFGIAQVGKAFRNEITPGNFTFRSREFEQMELQYFVKPDEAEGKKWFAYWKQARMDWYVSLGMGKEHLRFREHAPDERAHYAKEAWDIEYHSPFGWKEFEGIHHRADWDLSRHQKFSGKDLTYTDQESGEQYTPWGIETSGGADRATLFFLLDAYDEEGGGDDRRVVLRLHPRIAPLKVAIFPLLANKPALIEKAQSIYKTLKHEFVTAWDARGNIGKRYRSQDEIGTPFCVTVDFDTLSDNTVTMRDRDTMKQERIKIDELVRYLHDRLS
ncbi:MAG: glycine--tRNA ligase [bacterium]|nr:glycine--tRNA ligase [bacterium]